jgi:hypothetical protein
MRESGIGRVLVASLHQAIAEDLPTRLGFYESWLHAEGLREGSIGVAPLSAVLSFLRQEGEAYDRLMTHAGEYAAEWTVESMPQFERTMISSTPAWLRARFVLRLARQLVRSSCEKSRLTLRLRRGTAHIQVSDSIFCTVREPAPRPLCRFYAAAFSRLLVLFDLPATADVITCRAMAAAHTPCVITVSLSGQLQRVLPEETAA